MTNNTQVLNQHEIEYVQAEDKVVPISPYNTLITCFNEDMTVDRSATIKNFGQYYGMQALVAVGRTCKESLRVVLDVTDELVKSV